LADGLHVILCVGEPLAVRKRGIAAAKRYLKDQLTRDLKKAFGGARAKNITVAYEPIWAIGSGHNDNPRDAAEVAAFIKATTGGAKVLYGGSVNSRNAGSYVQLKEIDGALVGGASLKADEFGKLITSAAREK
jgi:triosephosphate isomerase